MLLLCIKKSQLSSVSDHDASMSPCGSKEEALGAAEDMLEGLHGQDSSDRHAECR